MKKTRLTEYDSNRSGGLIAINLRELGEASDDGAATGDRDELVGAQPGRCGRRHRAGLPQGPVAALPRHRRRAAADGPLDVRRHRHEVPRRRRAAGDGGRARDPARPRGRRGRRRRRRGGPPAPVRGVRERQRQAHRHRRVPGAGPGRPRHQGRGRLREARQPGRRRDGQGRRRGHGRDGEGQGRAVPRRRRRGQGPHHPGRAVRPSGRRRLDHRDHPQRRDRGRGRDRGGDRGRRRGWAPRRAADAEVSTDGAGRAEAGADGVPSDPDDSDASGETTGGEA